MPIEINPIGTPSPGSALAEHIAATENVHGVDHFVTPQEITDATDGILDSAIAYVDAVATPNVQTGTSYTPVTADAGNVIVECTNNGLVTITLPDAPAFIENAQIEFTALGTLGVTFAAGSGASIDSAGGLVDLPQNCSAVARHRGAGDWLLSGALA